MCVCVCVIEMTNENGCRVRFALNCFGKNKTMPVNTIKASGQQLSLWCLYVLFTQRLFLLSRGLWHWLLEIREEAQLKLLTSMHRHAKHKNCVFVWDCILHWVGNYLTHKGDFDFNHLSGNAYRTFIKFESVAFTLSSKSTPGSTLFAFICHLY